ncbi:peptide chain release factor eRF/aRF, subunit 1 [Aciduliprofundum sp. MAR08-339]|uniref:peptide chain release factor aRF-1 n=1 Tax=Aciduliprofundum sp. (strain MAR08-339) TaxID=673860 RepID=UPI0002A4A7A8|nr:peptide chain release factor eRF/aRF, subunit 1 [Aciduliprofundum sp. MAR08-339]
MDSEEARKKYEFRRYLEELEKYEGRGTELISVYVPPKRPISDVIAYLRDEYGTSANIKSKTTRKNVMSAIESIMSRLKYFKMPPPNGLVVFVGHVIKRGDQTEMVSYVFEPPEPVQSFIYKCDSKFYLEPLKAMLGDKDIYGLLVIDRKEATIGFLKGTRIEVVKHLDSMVPSKHHQGGQSSRRFERLIELAVHEFFKKVGDKANEVFLAEERLKGILVGGPGGTKDSFLKGDYLHHELKKKIIEVFDVGYTDEYGLHELVEKASTTLKNLEVFRERQLLQRFFKEIRKPDGGLALYGEMEVREALERGAVDVLLISDSLRRYRVTWKCPQCGYEIKETVKGAIPEKTCPNCGSVMDTVEKKDLIEEYYDIAEQFNTQVELISDESEEGKIFSKAFGGIAAILRYR